MINVRNVRETFNQFKIIAQVRPPPPRLQETPAHIARVENAPREPSPLRALPTPARRTQRASRVSQHAFDEAAAHPRDGPGGDAVGGGEAVGEGGAAGGEGVGALADGGGFSLGKAPDGAKPAVSVKVGGEASPGKAPAAGVAPGPARKAAGAGADGAAGGAAAKAELFKEYKEDAGAKQSGVLRENAAALREKKAQQKERAQEINRLKREIDELRIDLEARREGQGAPAADKSGEVVVDAEEFAVVRTLKQKKAQVSAPPPPSY